MQEYGLALLPHIPILGNCPPTVPTHATSKVENQALPFFGLGPGSTVQNLGRAAPVESSVFLLPGSVSKKDNLPRGVISW
eukprot:8462189-Karenia_brevis.AAC.1